MASKWGILAALAVLLAFRCVPVSASDQCLCQCCNYNQQSCVTPNVINNVECGDPEHCSKEVCNRRFSCDMYQFPIMFASCVNDDSVCDTVDSPACYHGLLPWQVKAISISVVLIVVIAAAAGGFVYYRRRKANRVALAVATSSPYEESDAAYTKISDDPNYDIVKV